MGESFYRNNIKEYQGKFVNGCFEGENCRVYHKNGKLWYTGAMKNKQFEGTGKLYDAWGKLEFAGVFAKGKPAGEERFRSTVELEKACNEQIKNVLQSSPKNNKATMKKIPDKSLYQEFGDSQFQHGISYYDSVVLKKQVNLDEHVYNTSVKKRDCDDIIL